MAVKPLRVGVVGTGFGRYHMEGFSQVPGVEILAICDLNKAEAQQFAGQYGAKHVFTSAKRMFAMDELDAVSIAVPNALHAPMTIDALSKGKHVLIEKPMTITPADAQKMADAAKKAGKLLMVEQALRFRPEAQLVKAYADRGEFGDMYYARSTWYRRKGWPHLHMPPDGTLGRGVWFLQKRLAGFGALGDIGVHLLDLAWYLMGTPKPVSVRPAFEVAVPGEGQGCREVSANLRSFRAARPSWSKCPGTPTQAAMSVSSWQPGRRERVPAQCSGAATSRPTTTASPSRPPSAISSTASRPPRSASPPRPERHPDPHARRLARSAKSGKEVRL